jgi:hypothetical protein
MKTSRNVTRAVGSTRYATLRDTRMTKPVHQRVTSRWRAAGERSVGEALGAVATIECYARRR